MSTQRADPVSLLLNAAKLRSGAEEQAAGVTTWASAKGSAYKQAIDTGMTESQAGLYSTLVGASEAGLQYLIGGVSQFGGINQWTEQAIAKIGTAEAQAAAKLGFSVLGEEVEENLQNYLEPLFTTLITGQAYEAPSFDEFLETTVATALMVAATEGAPALANKRQPKQAEAVSDTQEYQQLTAQLVERWAQAALEVPDETIQAAGQRILAAIERGETPQAEWVLQAAQAAGADSETVAAIRGEKNFSTQENGTVQQTAADAEIQNSTDDAPVRAGADFSGSEYSNTENIKSGAETRTERENGNAQQTSVADTAVQTVLDAAKTQQNTENAANTQRGVDISDDAQFRMVDYDDAATQKQVTEQTHARMVEQGKVVAIENNPEVAAHYPDLRAVKKQDRNAVLKEKISSLRNNIRSFLKSLKVNTYQFDIDGNVLEARIYDTGIKEVTEKLTESKANMLLQSDGIFKNAQYLYSTADKRGDSDVYRWNYFYTPVKIGDDIVGVRIAVRDVKRDNSSQIYHWGIKNDQTLGVAKRGKKSGPGGTSSVWSDNSIPQDSVAVNPQTGENVGAVQSSAKNNPQAAQRNDGGDWYTPTEDTGGVKATDSVGAAPAGFDPYGQALNEYGAIEPGENPARIVDVPKSVDGETNVTRLTRTAAEAAVTGESTMLPAIERAVVDGAFNRMPQKNAARRKAAEEWLATRSVTQATTEWLQASKRRVSAETQARGLMLYAKLSQLAEDTSLSQREREIYRDTGINVLRQLSVSAAEAGDTVQINRLLKQLSPDTQIEMLKNNITELEEFINKRTRKGRRAMKQADKDAGTTDGAPEQSGASGSSGSKLFKVNVNETLVQAWKAAMKAGDETKAQEAKDALYHDIAAQVPKTFMDRWNAWRYLGMLGNVKTIGKNLIGNVGMGAVKQAADKVAAGMEAALVDKSKRTKYGGALRASEQGRAMLDYVRESIYPAHKGTLKGERKYGTDANSMLSELMNAVREENSKFTAPVLKQWQQATDFMLNNEYFGDEAFLRKHFVESFSGAALARGWTVEQLASGAIPQAELDALSSYAVKRAQQATFRDVNAFSKLVSSLRSDNPVVGTVLSGVLPFRATPANVAVRGIEYSPVGLLKGISQLFKVWTNDKMDWKSVPDITTAIENFSQGAVGTALFALGALGASRGILHAEEDDDEDRTGIQGYSIELFGHTFTLDALSPAVIPLMMGVSAAEALGSGSSVLESILQAGLDSFQPMLEMTMLSGVSDMLDSMAYAKSNGSVSTLVSTFLVQPFISYLSQGIPTLASQIAQITRPYQTSTYTGDITSAKLRPTVRSLLNAAKKIPGLDYAAGLKQTVYVDEWGRANSSGNVAQRAITALLSPTYVSEVNETAADKEIARLIQTTGVTGVRPKKPSYTVTVIDEDGESAEKRLNADEYELYATVKGQLSLELVEALLDDAGYQALGDADKAAAIKKAYELADTLGKAALGVEFPQESWTKELQNVTAAEAAAELSWLALENSDLRDVFKGSELANERIGSGERTIGDLEAPKSVTVGEDGESYRFDAEDYEQYRDAYLAVWEETDTEGLSDRQRARLHNIAVAAGKAAALADEGVDYEEESISANYKTARDAGISSEAYLAAWEAKEDITDTVDMGGRAKAFRQWLETDGKEYGFTKAQKSTLEELYKSYMMAPETTGNYGEMLDAGIPEAKARQISDRIDALQPESGKKSVSDKQKAQAIVKGGYSGKETYLAVKAYISSSTGEKLTQAYEAGVSAKRFVAYWYGADANGNGSISRAEAIEWLDSSGLTRSQKALLLRLRNASWKNPYE